MKVLSVVWRGFPTCYMHEDSHGSSGFNVCGYFRSRYQLGHPVLQPRCELMHRGGHLSRNIYIYIELIHKIKGGGILVRRDLLPTHEQNGVRLGAAYDSCFAIEPFWKGTHNSCPSSASTASHVEGTGLNRSFASIQASLLIGEQFCHA